MALGRAEKFLSWDEGKGIGREEEHPLPLNPTATPLSAGLTSGEMCAKHLKSTPLVSIMVSCLVTQPTTRAEPQLVCCLADT